MTASVKEATQDALESVRTILVQSIQSESSADLLSLVLADAAGLNTAIDATLASLKRLIFAPIQEELEELNFRLPVNQLPLEILESIFLEYLSLTRSDAAKLRDVYGTGINHHAVLSLALVSQRWYRVVFGTPSLWAVVSVAMPPSQVDKWLNLSRSHPLDIHCEVDPDDFETDVALKASLFRFVKVITPNLGRSRLIRVALSWERMQDALSILSTPNEAIEMLELCQEGRRAEETVGLSESPSATLFQVQAPRLAHMVISGFELDWHTLARFPALQTLKLRTLTIPASGMDRVLRECAALRTLELEDVLLDIDTNAPGQFVDVPNLRRLVVRGLDPRAATVVSRIRNLRSLESVRLFAYPPRRTDLQTYIQATIAHLSPDFSRIMGSASRVRIDWTGGYNSINNTAGSFRLNFTTFDYSDLLYHHFCNIVLENGFSGDVDLFIGERALFSIQRDIWPRLNVSRLTLREAQYHPLPSESASQILMSLSDFLEDPHNWSTLRCIRLDFNEIHLDQLASCLQKRYSGTYGSSVELQHLNIYVQCWENGSSGLEELKGTHGVDSVILEERGRNQRSKYWDDEVGL